MTPTPILLAETALATALAASLRPILLAAGYGHAGAGRAWWRLIPIDLTPAPALPYVIFQVQGDIAAAPYLNGIRAEASVLIKGLAMTAAAARAVANVAAPGMAALSYAGHVLQATYRASPNLPIDQDRVWQAGHLYRVRISATS